MLCLFPLLGLGGSYSGICIFPSWVSEDHIQGLFLSEALGDVLSFPLLGLRGSYSGESFFYEGFEGPPRPAPEQRHRQRSCEVPAGLLGGLGGFGV